MQNENQLAKYRRYHYWRGFLVGSLVTGLLMFVLMSNIIIYIDHLN